MKIGDYVKVKLEISKQVRVGRIDCILNSGLFHEYPIRVAFPDAKFCSCTRNEVKIISNEEAMLWMLENA